jgi:hypothetical protein
MPGPRSATLMRPSGLVPPTPQTTLLNAEPRFHQVSDGIRDRVPVSFDKHRIAISLESNRSVPCQCPRSHRRNNVAGHLGEVCHPGHVQHDRIQSGDPQQLLDKSVHTRHVGLEFDEIVIALDLFERGRDDCQRRPLFVSSIRSELALDGETLLDPVERTINRGYERRDLAGACPWLGFPPLWRSAPSCTIDITRARDLSKRSWR